MGPQDQVAVKQTLKEFADVFAKDSPDLGQTSVLKHELKLKEGAQPFKERYHHIPLGLYDEVCQHIKEMLEIGP